MEQLVGGHGERTVVVTRTRVLTVIMILPRKHAWSEPEERDEYERRMREMESRVNIPSHGQSTKDFLPDVIRGWRVLQRSGLSESSKKTVLGSTENTLGRSRIVEALKQQWPDHELLMYDGDRKRDRDRKMRAYVQAEGDEWEPEMHQSEIATENAWNTSELRDSWKQASWDEAGTWEDEDDQFEGSFADEDEEEAGRNSIKRSPSLREKCEENRGTGQSNHA